MRVCTLNIFVSIFKGGRCDVGFLYNWKGDSGSDCVGVTSKTYNNEKTGAAGACSTYYDSNLLPNGKQFCTSDYRDKIKVLEKVQGDFNNNYTIEILSNREI